MQATRIRIAGVLALLVAVMSCEKDGEEEWRPDWPCTDFYLDEDGDGWGTDATRCDWDVPDGYATRPGDCCDSDPAVHPFADFSGRPHECPILQWDFDCDGVVEMDFPDAGVFTGCGEFCIGSGWFSAVPDCGQPGTFKSCSFSSDPPPEDRGHGWPHDYPGTDPLPPPPCTLTCHQYETWSGPRGCR